MIIKIDSERTIDTDELTYAELKVIKQEVDDAVLSIQSQIDMARANRFETGEFSSPQWYAKANIALRYRRKTMQILQEALSKKKKSEALRGRSLADYIVDLCREQMTTDEFSSFCSKAEKRRLAALEEKV